MKILVAGDWHSELHEEAVFAGLMALDQDVHRFAWHTYFQARGPFASLARLLLRAQNKYMSGPVIRRLNDDLVARAIALNPDAIFVYRGTHILPRTLRRIRAALPGVVLIGYNNDDPFAPGYPRWLWRHFLGCVPLYDLTLAYRKRNLSEYLAAGAQRVELLRSWFIPERNHPVTLGLQDEERFGCDVVFVGHYEDDGRLQHLEEIVRRGWRLRIWGPGYDWDPVLQTSEILSGHVPVKLVWGEEYNKALAGAKMALCFFSKLNRDTYTRRCFEIPAAGTVLLSEYTEDLASLYRENQEAVFFRSSEEMCMAIKSLLSDKERRLSISAAGNSRVTADGHDVVSRMRMVLGWIDEISGARS